jgi:hypothetical protein
MESVHRDTAFTYTGDTTQLKAEAFTRPPVLGYPLVMLVTSIAARGIGEMGTKRGMSHGMRRRFSPPWPSAALIQEPTMVILARCFGNA